jgi:uncharacterized OB-fold protein
MFCQFCGNTVVATAVVCPHCGSPIKGGKVESGGASQGLVVAGYALGFLMPLIGFIIGIVLLSKGTANHGVGARVVSLCSFFFWAGVMGG